jgi:DMSO/TMAO reductase YedYZ molybdopterin-dependent catalytic subunit
MKPPKLDPAGFHSRITLAPHQLTDELTRREDVVVLCHFGVPRIERSDWTLTIDGLVAAPTILTFDDLSKFPRRRVTSIHECAGSPLTPDEPKRRITNVEWSGIALRDLLGVCRVSEQARFIWSIGADYGEFSGVAVDRYLKDLPLERVSEDVLVATELNGLALSAEHGFPARLVVPGFYGTNSVKWLTRMTLADTRATGPFTTRWYNDAIRDDQGRDTGRTEPVWSIAPESVIVSPAPSARIPAGKPCEVWGRAWGDAPIDAVETSVDGGSTWTRAALTRRIDRSWQRFSFEWKPDRVGVHQLISRARDSLGREQPASRRRNAVHMVEVEVF